MAAIHAPNGRWKCGDVNLVSYLLFYNGVNLECALMAFSIVILRMYKEKKENAGYGIVGWNSIFLSSKVEN